MEIEASVAALKEAERKAAEIEKDAEKRNEERLKEARQQAANVVDKGGKEAAAFKDKMLAEERKNIEAEVGEIASKSRKNADAVRKAKVPAGAARKIAEGVFKDLV
jgi:vacuolar-type H+-ATPase subunit H